MKKILILVCFIIIMYYNYSYAAEGDCGYEGGISSGQNLSTSTSSIQYDYQEVVFLTGQPVVLKGLVTIKSKTSNGIETKTYQYDLSDSKNDSLKRTITLQSTETTKNNNQLIKETSLYKTPVETITINNVTYTLLTYYLTKSSILDSKPAVGYYTGNLTSKKVYEIGGDANKTVTVTTNGEFYGYDQTWGNAETQSLDYYIEKSTDTDKWSGTAKVKLSSTTTNDFKYYENSLDVISFDGGYVKTKNTTSKLTYESKMPRFDKDNISTDSIITKTGTLRLDAFPQEQRLMIQDLSSIRGHWAESDIKKLYSLEIYDENPILFEPNAYISRAEFAKALWKAINPVAPTTSKTKTATSPFSDISVKDAYFPYIQGLTSKNILNDYDDGKFYPLEPITRIQAIVAFVRVLGLEGMSKDQYPVTPFKDNDKIPSWALRAVYAANKIGFVTGEEGYLVPDRYLTKAETAVLISRLIDYMSNTLAKNYSDNIINY